ncbi:MAG: rhodanese-like domain-containing protein [Planctomycetota bacterium]|jgi:thiosulfate/3-mercaptopyruvate sulfurtransferase
MRRNLCTIFLIAAVLAGMGLASTGCSKKKKDPIIYTGDPGSMVWDRTTLLFQQMQNPDLVILDTRMTKYYDNGVAYLPYDVGHIPGAQYLSVGWLGDESNFGYANDSYIAEKLGALGITTDTTICIYDIGVATSIGRAFYHLYRLGCKDTHILDGGFPAWERASGETTAVVTLPTPTTFVATVDNSYHWNLVDFKAAWDDVQNNGDLNNVIVDYREEPLFSGHKICPDAAFGGHIPDTHYLSYFDLFDNDGFFKTEDEITSLHEALGCDQSKTNVLICNFGWRSGVAFFALLYAGWPESCLKHYTGGFREWSWQTYADSVTYPYTTHNCFDYVNDLDEAMTFGVAKGTQRYAGASAQVGTRVYCMGGMGISYTGQVTATAQYYDFSDNNVATLASLPEPIAFSAGAAVGTNVYVIGGYDNDGLITDKVYCYDTSGGTWDDGTVIASLPVGRWSFSATAIGDTIYAGGGLISKIGSATASYSDTLYSLDTSNGSATWVEMTNVPLPTITRCHALLADGDNLFLIGGMWYDETNSTSPKKYLTTLYYLDTTNLPAGWTQLTDGPGMMAGHSAALVNGKIYVPGSALTANVYEYDPATDTWTTLYTTSAHDSVDRTCWVGWKKYWYFLGANGDHLATIGGFAAKSNQTALHPWHKKKFFNHVYLFNTADGKIIKK